MITHPRRAFILLLVYMFAGPPIAAILMQCRLVLVEANQEFGFTNRVVELFDSLTNQFTDHLDNIYTLFLPGMTLLGIVIAFKAMRNRGVSLFFAVAAALVICLILNSVGLVFHHGNGAFSFSALLLDLILWSLTSALCWNFSQFFHAHLPLKQN